jgi:type I restriction enzyme S subunit
VSDLDFQHYPIDIDAIPKSWCVTSVAALGTDVQSGFPTGEHNKEGHGIPHIRPMNIDRNGVIDLNDVKYVAPVTSVLRLQQGDVLFNNTNSPELIGKTAAITHCEEWGFSNHMTRLRFPAEDVEYRFAAHQLHFLWIVRYFRHRCVNHVNQASISGKPLAHTVPFLIAPLAEQARIVAKIEELFSDLDTGVAALKRAKANLKRYRASVLKAAVEGKLTEQWRAKHPAKEPASALLARILVERRQKWEADQLAKFAAAKKEPPKNWRDKYVEPTPPDTTGLPELPEGWCWASVEQTSEVQGGIQKQPKRAPGANSFPFLRVANVHRNQLELDEVYRIELFGNEIERLRLQTGDLLVVEGNGSKTEIGRSAIWTGEIEDCVHQNHIIRVRFLAGSSRYLNSYWNSPSGNGRVMEQAASTSGLYTLSVTKVCSLPVPLAPIVEQEQIVAEVEERLSVVSAAEIEISNSLLRASRLRQSILKRAFEGKLVPQDPKDESASALLERLRASRTHDEANGTAATSKPNRAKVKESSGEPRTRIRRGPSSQNQLEQ